jgi:transcriptional regulator with XRE-family HTH domain
MFSRKATVIRDSRQSRLAAMMQFQVDNEAQNDNGKTGLRLEKVLQIAAMRQHEGLSQRKLGDRIGVEANTIARYERGEMCPSYEKLQALAEVFHCKLFELFIKREYSTDEPINGKGPWAAGKAPKKNAGASPKKETKAYCEPSDGATRAIGPDATTDKALKLRAIKGGRQCCKKPER